MWKEQRKTGTQNVKSILNLFLKKTMTQQPGTEYQDIIIAVWILACAPKTTQLIETFVI